MINTCQFGSGCSTISSFIAVHQRQDDLEHARDPIQLKVASIFQKDVEFGGEPISWLSRWERRCRACVVQN